ncbi:uncharacterized protein LOC114341184 [Diabrotica virgifera virgifera]|uniref:Uncharacterized protein LOC114341184 n=1 Tax=Diabrotica virgifera virgifera TaxID=50390 RepID=A0A6P7GE17_DIAVI|nr:uncharacterized protein LOC114341184 [Diabrotica virgifera virgifera]
MKWIVLTVVVLLGLASAEEVSEKRAVLRRTTRQALGSMGGSFLAQTERNIINNCKKNGLSDQGADDLQATYAKMKSCMSGTKIFETPRNEFISKMEDCSRDAIKETKSCLANNQKYFPEFVLDLAKSMVKYMYDDKDLFRDSEIVGCINNLGRYTVQVEYIRCLTTVSQKTGDDENIPTSRAEFCRKFVPATECFPDTIKQHCVNTAKVNKFFSDYSNAIETPCQDSVKESNYL